MWLIEPSSEHEYTKQPCDWHKVSDVHYNSVGRTLVCMAIIKQPIITVTPCCIAGVMPPFLFCIRNFRILDVVCLLEKKHFDNIWRRFYQFNTKLSHLKTHVEDEYSYQHIYCFQQTSSTDEQTLNISYWWHFLCHSANNTNRCQIM